MRCALLTHGKGWVQNHEIRIRRMIVTGQYDKDLADRLDGLFREWGVEGARSKLLIA